MTPVELSRTVLRAMRRAVDAGELRGDVPERVLVERPRAGGHGDYATNLALQVARDAGKPPLSVAEILSARLRQEPGIGDVGITGPGFLNITLEAAGDPRGPRDLGGSGSQGGEGSASGAEAAVVRDILQQGPHYGHVHPAEAAGGPEQRLVQLHTPHEPRALVLADALRRILRSQGALVRVSCDAAPEPAWVEVLGVHADGYGVPPAEDRIAVLRPVPVRPADHAELLRLGADAARWALLHPAAHDRPRVDGSHLVQGEANPLFRVRYAHARTRALLRNAADLGLEAEPGDVRMERAEAAERAAPLRTLLEALADYPRTLAAADRRHAPDRLARYLVDTSDAFLACQHTALPLGDEKPSAAHRSRLALAEATGTVLAGGLSLLGISAPEYL
ncbi:ArgS-related anticodon-binding protein NrtL [Streptomyces sp. NPDC059009]|uniref:ArgS-related anticodon-binding protein NrtL n=1 Tax=Streptomyces sp. NPDC059009 TaxID=3346694 RepID=UPI0036B0C342